MKEKGNWEVMQRFIEDKIRLCSLRAIKNEDIN